MGEALIVRRGGSSKPSVMVVQRSSVTDGYKWEGINTIKNAYCLGASIYSDTNNKHHQITVIIRGGEAVEYTDSQGSTYVGDKSYIKLTITETSVQMVKRYPDNSIRFAQLFEAS